MKAYTDLEQSKKLAEILPLESADMTWEQVTNALTKDFTWKPTIGLDKAIVGNLFSYRNGYVLPCWGLASLLEQLDDEITDEDGNDYNLTIVKENLQYQLYYHDSWGEVEDIETDYYDDLVDACYEMIEKLHKLKML